MGWNWTDQNWTDRNQTDQNRTDRNRTARPDQTGPERHPRSRGFPSRIKDQGSDHGSRIKHPGSRIKDKGSRIKDLGPCFGMNEHPGRDTDVISRLSNSTIEDLSFYIGFTRIGSRILDLGPWIL